MLSLLALTCLGGVASADRGHGNRGNHGNAGHAPGGVVVRDHRTYNRQPTRQYSQPRRAEPRRVRYERRPVYYSNNRYTFRGGYVRTYHRPVIRYRYYNYNVRPQLIIEQQEAVPGYIWVSGQWQWNGYEWTWQQGYYAPDPSYQTQSYEYGYDTNGDGYPDE